MPGLVNAHTHLELTAMRGFLDGLDFRKWLSTLTAARNAVFDAGTMLDSATLGIQEGLLNGITTYADCASSTAPLAAMRASGVRGIGYIETFGPDVAQRDESMRVLVETVNAERARDTPLVSTGVSPHAPYTVSAPLFQAVASFADAEGLRLAVHVSESAAETSFVRDGAGPFAERLRERGIAVSATGHSPVQWLASTGMLGARTLLIHGVQMSEQDVELAASSGSTLVHCPISNAKLGHGIAPLDLFRRHCLNVGLGSDSVASNNRMDLLGEARMAVLAASVRAGMPDALSAAEALRMATLGGAEALGLADRVGSLEAGKDADIAVFPIDRVEAIPEFEPEALLVHALAGAVQASHVMVAGRTLVRDRTIVDPVNDLYDRVRALGVRLAGWRVR